MKNLDLRLALYNLATLSAAIVIIYSVSGLGSAILAFPLTLTLELAVYFYELKLKRKLSYTSELDATLLALRMISNEMRYGGKPISAGIGCVKEALNLNASSVVYKTLDGIYKRLASGQDLNQSIEAACAKDDCASYQAFNAVSREYTKNPDAALAVKNTYGMLLRERLLDREKAYGSLQKYLTISMALSAVLPSFVVFAFVGYSMVYYSTSLLLIFSFLMLVLLPKLYALLRIHIAGIYAL